jgi:hypothetical protein
VGNGNIVTWTERLTPRAVRSADPWSKTMTVEVSAVVAMARSPTWSAPYPPLPLKPPPAVAIAEPTSHVESSRTTTPAPVTMFLGSALGLGLTALVVARGPSAVRATLHRRRPPPHRASVAKPTFSQRPP